MSTPRWLTAIENALAQHRKQTVIQLATISTHAAIPEVRSHILRSLLTPPSAPSLPLLVTTTDIRSPKVSQIMANPNVHVVHWIDSTQEQFRFAGLAIIVPSQNHTLYQRFADDLEKARKLGSCGIAALIESGFDWEKKRIEVFKGLSGHMKATWCRPTPGGPLIGGEEEARKWPVKLEEPMAGQSTHEWETALENFALLIIDPRGCDYIELGVEPNRRTKFSRSEDGTWKEETLIP